MGDLLSSNVQTFFPDTDDPYLKFVVKCQIVTETLSIPLNVALLILFHRLYQTNKHKMFTHASRTKRWDQTVVIFTYLLLLFGLAFSICQGLFENFALHNCASIINTYTEFFFFVGHRTLLLLIFLNRLFAVFAGSVYGYPISVYYVLFTLIIVYGVLSWTCHAFNLAIMKVQSGWSLWNGDGYVCGWQFGVLVTHMIRPFDYVLNVTILFLFLYKLYDLHKGEQVRRRASRAARPKRHDDKSHPSGGSNTDIKTQTITTSTERRKRKEHSNLEIVARRITALTFVALFTSILVTGGYLGYHMRIITVLWSWDLAINSYCCILVLTWANFMINPCFGKKCDRCCCIKCIQCCECVLIGPFARTSHESVEHLSNLKQPVTPEMTTDTVYDETQVTQQTQIEITLQTQMTPPALLKHDTLTLPIS
eukprot:26633_1